MQSAYRYFGIAQFDIEVSGRDGGKSTVARWEEERRRNEQKVNIQEMGFPNFFFIQYCTYSYITYVESLHVRE